MPRLRALCNTPYKLRTRLRFISLCSTISLLSQKFVSFKFRQLIDPWVWLDCVTQSCNAQASLVSSAFWCYSSQWSVRDEEDTGFETTGSAVSNVFRCWRHEDTPCWPPADLGGLCGSSLNCIGFYSSQATWPAVFSKFKQYIIHPLQGQKVKKHTIFCVYPGEVAHFHFWTCMVWDHVAAVPSTVCVCARLKDGYYCANTGFCVFARWSPALWCISSEHSTICAGSSVYFVQHREVCKEGKSTFSSCLTVTKYNFKHL